ncbi:MFS transporter [Nocardioides albidus]|uniref:MFS transporter n=1 Tax=Nocardioides albidus TaxID=1517589 RepID=A0A5C4VKD5_9ACTN|nr:MFS transporter [Nocardioides albidus]TNM36308.1 MFS transporter [Nocardioides albidus]
MSTPLSGDPRGFFARLMPPVGLPRRLAAQGMVFALGESAFMTGSAVFLTKVVGMSAGRAGLALTIMGIAQFAFSYPAGRIIDRVGPKRIWAAQAVARALVFLALPFVDGFGQYVVAAVLMGAFTAFGRSSHQAYVYDVLPPETRVQTQSYMYSWLNIGHTFGALVGGLALATGSLEVIRWTPVVTAALMVLNAIGITRLPAAPHDLRVSSGEARIRPAGPGPMRNIGWILTTFFLGVMWTNQILLNVVIPLWLVEATDAPHVLLAWLFGTNTVLCIFLPAYTSQGVRTLDDALRYAWISSAFFVVSCVITMITHSTVGLVTVLLVWLGHVTVTGAELAISGASWSFEAELSDPERRGEYQGVQEVAGALGFQWSPAVYTFLALSWGAEGWLVIAAIIVGATVGLGPSVHAARRFAERNFRAVAAEGATPTPTA